MVGNGSLGQGAGAWPTAPGIVLRDAALVAAGVVAVLVVAEFIWMAPLVWGRPGFSTDEAFYRAAAQHWLDTGQFYLPNQLEGPYHVVLSRDVLYPPIALVLFVPLTLVPPIAWWVVPIAVIVYTTAQLRPAAWTWPLLGLVLLWPRSQGAVLWGNSDLWVAALVSAGMLWGWPAALIALKPTFLPLALVGVRHRSWWIAVAFLSGLTIPLLPLWADYFRVIRDSDVPWTYSLLNTPLVLFPLVAWMGRTRPHRSPRPRPGVAALAPAPERVSPTVGG